MRLEDLIARVRADLTEGSASFVTDELCTAYINEAMCFVQSVRPELFSVSKTIDLNPGHEQLLGECGCSTVLDVVSVLDEKGERVGATRKTDERLAQIANLFTNCKSGQISSFSYTIDSVVKNRFSLSPGVPNGRKLKAIIRCVEAPKQFVECDDDTSLACATYLPVLLYVQSKAISAQSPDSATAKAQSNDALNQAIALLRGSQSANTAVRKAA
jgi:hypothetical protein